MPRIHVLLSTVFPPLSLSRNTLLHILSPRPPHNAYKKVFFHPSGLLLFERPILLTAHCWAPIPVSEHVVRGIMRVSKRFHTSAEAPCRQKAGERFQSGGLFARRPCAYTVSHDSVHRGFVERDPIVDQWTKFLQSNPKEMRDPVAPKSRCWSYDSCFRRCFKILILSF